MEPVLNCQSLTKTFGAKTALDHFTAAVYGGRITGLLGPNGSGKTTLIKLAAGLLTPTAGAVTIGGRAPDTYTKAHVAYLPDRMSLPNTLRVREAIEFFADFYADFSREKAAALLADLKIEPDDRIGAMSKGTKEKLQLALVMSRAADLYLLDEPIGGVDPAARDRILDTIIRNYREEAALVISTHLIGDIEPVLDDVIMIQDGKTVLSGNVEDLREAHGKSMDALFREVFKC